jgi:hypothetical protein
LGLSATETTLSLAGFMIAIEHQLRSHDVGAYALPINWRNSFPFTGVNIG